MDRKGSHILLVRLSAMGDVAMVTHVVRALRSLYPDLRISILTRKRFQPIFNGLDVEFVPLDLSGRHKGVAGMYRLAKDISSLDIDYVADLHNVLRTKMLRAFLKLSGVRVAHLKKGRIDKWMRMDGGCNEVTKPLRHMVLRYCDVVHKIGYAVADPTLPVSKGDRRNPLPFEKGAERWIGVAPFAAHRGKVYPQKYMRQVVEQLSKRYDRLFIHSGGGSELDFALELQRDFPNVMALFGKITIGEEIDLISYEDCIVTMDSFAMHVGSMVATPVVSVWGATHPSLGFAGYGCSPKGYVQLESMVCRPCSAYGNKACRFGDYRCLNDISPLDIVERVDQNCTTGASAAVAVDSK
ncbi:MAG: glycosyltransferase family 9 protein [Rikenellaceae bacterium]